MGFLQRLHAPRASFSRSSGPGADEWYAAQGWITSLQALGMTVTPELALTLSHVFCAVDIISGDFGTMPCQLFRDLGDDRGRARVYASDRGIGRLAYQLKWQPNNWQTAKAFWSTMTWQYLLRPACYAEIVYQPGSDSFVDQLIPRHPDRVEQQVLPSGRLRFKLTEATGTHRYVTQEEMFVVRNTSTDGLKAFSRIEYGGTALTAGLALQEFTKNYFTRGATAALLATYKGGEMEEGEETRLHARMMRFLAGPENAGGVFLTNEDMDVKNIGVAPEQAQLLGLKNLSGRDVARMFKLPPNWLAIEGAQSYGSAVQDTQDYTRRCQIPLAVEFEQAIQRDLIVAAGDLYFAKFNMNYILRASLKERMEAYDIGIRARVIRPSEARALEDMGKDEELDRLSALDHRAGSQRDGADNKPQGQAPSAAQIGVRTTLIMHDKARSAIRRERHEIEKLAKKCAGDADGWKAGLRAFYESHAQYLSDNLRLHPDIARAYAAQHGNEFEARGAVSILGPDAEQWERFEAEELTTLALADGNSVDGWFSRRLVDPKAPAAVHVASPIVTIAEHAVSVDARTTVEPTHVEVGGPVVNVPERSVTVHAPVTVSSPKVDVVVEEGAIQHTTTIEAQEPSGFTVDKTVTRGAAGIEKVHEVHAPLKPNKKTRT